MATNLFVRLCSGVEERRMLLELTGTGRCTGRLLAGVLADRFPGVDWFMGSVPLAHSGTLPSRGEIFVADLPLSGAPGPDEGPGGWPEARGSRGRGPGAQTALVVVRGPDPGGVLELRRGTYSLGRGDADLRIGDPLLSRRHALLHVSETSILLNDEGSANGLWQAGTRIHTRRLLLGENFTAGDSTFEVMPLRQVETGRGPWPLAPIRAAGTEPSSRIGLLLAGALTPLVMGLGLYLVTHSLLFLAFSAVSVLTGGLPALFWFRARRVHDRELQLAGRQDLARRAELGAPLGAVAAGLRPAHTIAPDGLPPVVPGRALMRPWTRSEPGHGQQPDRKRRKEKRRRAGREQRARKLRTACRKPRQPPCADLSPVLLRLLDGQLLHFDGAEAQWAGRLRAVLVRWLPLLESGSLRVLVRGPAGFLPSGLLLLSGVEVLAPEAALASRTALASKTAVQSDGHGTPTVVLLASGTERPPVPGEAGGTRGDGKSGAPVVWIRCGPATGPEDAHARIGPGRVLMLDEAAQAANPWLAAGSCSTAGNGTHAGAGERGDAARDPAAGLRLELEPETLGFAAMERAVRLAAVHEGRRVPRETADAPGVSESGKPALATVIGDGAGGEVVLDLFRHGPHLLVAGTTGSGKSELLRSLVLGLAKNHGPDVLAFMLVDFKGGATLAPLAGLPQVQSTVSDLDAAAAQRLLEQLSCELRRREKLLASRHATDLAGYLAARSDTDPLLPSLVVVVDEFRVFATELPGALENIVQLATVGRSLGIHLVLSTQRPSGTLNAQLRANISTVIALRTIGDFESADLIGSNAAADLDPAEPGWAFMRVGGGKAVKFRARVNAQAGTDLLVRAWGRDLGAPLWQANTRGRAVGRRGPAAEPESWSVAPGGVSPAEELAAVVADIGTVWSGTDRAGNPFSRALPRTLQRIPRAVWRSLPPATAVAGLVDRVDSPRPAPLVFDPAGCSRLAVCGPPGSGSELVPEVLVRALNLQAWTVPCFVLDGNGTHAGLAAHPGVRGYFGPQDSWRIRELLDHLDDPVRGTGLVLVVSGLAGWEQSLGSSVYPLLDAALAAFARTAGSATGRTLVVCGDRDLAGCKAAALCEWRWYFPLGAGAELLMGWPRLKPAGRHPGRGLLTGPGEPESGVEFQVLDPAALGAPPRTPVPSSWIGNVPLPDSLGAGQLRAPASEANADAGGPGYPLGVCGPDNRVFRWSPGACGVVVGRESAGRNAVLEHLAALSLPGGLAAVHCRASDPLPLDTADLAARVREQAPASPSSTAVGLVVIDEADSRPLESARSLSFLLSKRIPVVIGVEPSSRVLVDLGLIATVRDARAFLVLDPRSPADADPSGFRFTPDPRSVRGRALVADGGTLRQIQCVNRG